MKNLQLRSRQLGQGMTEYIIIVSLIAVAAIGVYQAFGTVVKGQTAAAVATLAGGNAGGARNNVDAQVNVADTQGRSNKTLKNFERH